jgi:hypothetical protein
MRLWQKFFSASGKEIPHTKRTGRLDFILTNF